MPTMMRADSTEYVHVPLPVIPPGVSLATDTFDMAFKPTKNAVVSGGAWHPAIYDAVLNTVKLLVGPGGVNIGAGSWHVVLRITDNPEVPVIDCPGKFLIHAVT